MHSVRLISSLLLVAMTFLGGHDASPLDDPRVLEAVREGRADAGGYMDQVLANLRDVMRVGGMGRIGLPNATMGFEHLIGGINWHGEAVLTEGFLANLDTIHRTGVADLSIEASGDLVITAEVGCNAGTLGYAVAVTFMDLGPHATAEGTLSRVRLMMSLRVTPDLIVHLDKFEIKSTGTLSLEVKGLGAVLNFLVEILGGFVGNLVKPIVSVLLEGPIKNLVNEIISNIRFPPDALAVMSGLEPRLLNALLTR